MENQLPNSIKAMEEELIGGHDMANQLLEVLVQDKLNTHLEEEGATIGALTKMIRDAKQSNKYREFKITPPLYRTTYYSHHTCKSPMNPEITVEPLSPSASSILLSFNSNLQGKQENPFSSSILASTKHEPQEVIHNEHSAQNQLSTFENLLFYDYDIPFDYSRNATLLSSTEAVQFESVYEQYVTILMAKYLFQRVTSSC